MGQQNINLVEYLKMAAELESSAYRQERAIERLNDYIKKNDPQLKYDRAIQTANQERRNLPEEKTYTEYLVHDRERSLSARKKDIIGLGSWSALFFFGGVFLCWLGIQESVGFIVLIGIILIAPAVLLIISHSSENKKEDEEYQRRLSEAQKKCKQDYDDKLSKIESEIEKARLSLPEDKKRDAFAKDERNKLSISLSKTKEILSKLYESNIIYPKYRNMVAMCSIYEYCATGRCTDLVGPDGAYNLYENELRQNMIIDKLDAILDQLEAIKRNQYMMYLEMIKTNDLLNGVQAEMKSIYYSVEEIKQNSYISAQCAQIAAQNSEILKYIALINS